MTEEIQEIKKRIFNKTNNSSELHISRVPKDTLKVFKDFAREEFCGDYGFAFKHIVSELLVKPPIYLNLQEQIFRLTKEFEELKNNNNKESSDLSDADKKSKIVRNDSGSRVIRKSKIEE